MHVRQYERLSLLSSPPQAPATRPLHPAAACGWSARRALKATAYGGVGVLGGAAVLATGVLLFGPGPPAPDQPAPPSAPASLAASAQPNHPAGSADVAAMLAALRQEIRQTSESLERSQVEDPALPQSLDDAPAGQRTAQTAVSPPDNREAAGGGVTVPIIARPVMRARVKPAIAAARGKAHRVVAIASGSSGVVNGTTAGDDSAAVHGISSAGGAAGIAAAEGGHANSGHGNSGHGSSAGGGGGR